MGRVNTSVGGFCEFVSSDWEDPPVSPRSETLLPLLFYCFLIYIMNVQLPILPAGGILVGVDMSSVEFGLNSFMC